MTTDDIDKIASTYHNWKKDNGYEDVLGFCKSASKEEIEKHNFILTPGRYIGIEEEKNDGIPFEDKMKALTSALAKQMEEEKRLDEEIKKNLAGIGFKV